MAGGLVAMRHTVNAATATRPVGRGRIYDVLPSTCRPRGGDAVVVNLRWWGLFSKARVGCQRAIETLLDKTVVK